MNDDRRLLVRAARHAGLVLLSLLFVPPSGARAEDALGDDSKRWLARMSLHLLPEEAQLFGELASAQDRTEFQRIYWARRDPDPRTPENELEEAIQAVGKRADELYSIPGKRGSETGCGKVLALLGEPLERTGREVQLRFDASDFMKQDKVQAETWTYRDRPGYPVTFTGGELSIAFDSNCEFAEGGRVLEELRRVAAALVVHPEVDYRLAPDGHLMPLEAATPAPGGGSLLISGRSDFPFEVEPKLVLRTQEGDAYAAGLIRAELGSTPASETATVVAAVVDDSGVVGSVAERTVRLAVVSGGASVASWGVELEPGQHTVRVGLKAGSRAAVAPVEIEVPDFNAPELTTSSLILFPEGEGSPKDDPQDPYAALTVGTMPLQPRFGNVFGAKDSLQVVCVLYGGAVDPASGQAALSTRFSFLKDGRPVAQDQPQLLLTPMAVASVGPIPLSGFDLGSYVVRLEVEDQVAGHKEKREAFFQITE